MEGSYRMVGALNNPNNNSVHLSSLPSADLRANVLKFMHILGGIVGYLIFVRIFRPLIAAFVLHLQL